MGDNSKSGDNRIFQLLTVLITAVVGPLVVFFVTSGSKNPAPVVQPTAVQGTVVQATAVAQATMKPTSVELQPTAVKPIAATPEGLRNPKGIVPAGTTVLVGNLALRVEPEDVQVDGHNIALKLRIRNLADSPYTLVTTAGAVQVKDNTGKTYAPFYGDKKTACKKQDITVKHSIQLNQGQEMLFQSAESAQANQWCTDDTGKYLPLFVGPLDKDAKTLRVGFNNFGPFKDFVIEVDR